VTSAAPILIVSGPPGAGKTTVARRLAETSEAPAVHLRTDSFYDAIRSGFIDPWLAESNDQNTTVTRAIVAAAGVYATGGYTVIVDGVVGPWFLDIYRAEAARLGVALDYVVLRADLERVTARARDRADHPLADYPPRVFDGFADLGPLEPHVIDNGGDDVEALLGTIRGGCAEGRFRLG
jgi:predicted kinase